MLEEAEFVTKLCLPSGICLTPARVMMLLGLISWLRALNSETRTNTAASRAKTFTSFPHQTWLRQSELLPAWSADLSALCFTMVTNDRSMHSFSLLSSFGTQSLVPIPCQLLTKPVKTRRCVGITADCKFGPV
ncbi:hypothetical protein BaRGS_00013564 [Batillaria attramentaria]|uniref:Uncharacterized protein n=1 Tax=Batillaria attramentaria TaxID=370345 RepID=A0ABD0L720_9CAEN